MVRRLPSRPGSEPLLARGIGAAALELGDPPLAPLLDLAGRLGVARQGLDLQVPGDGLLAEVQRREEFGGRRELAERGDRLAGVHTGVGETLGLTGGELAVVGLEGGPGELAHAELLLELPEFFLGVDPVAHELSPGDAEETLQLIANLRRRVVD